jgi:hypothetical protein
MCAASLAETGGGVVGNGAPALANGRAHGGKTLRFMRYVLESMREVGRVPADDGYTRAFRKTQSVSQG